MKRIFILRLSLRSFFIFLLIYNHSYPFESLYFYPFLYSPLILIYPFLSFTYLHLSQSLYPSLFPTYPCLSFSILCQSRILLIFLNLYLLININTCLAFSIFWESGILLIFLNLYLLIHVNSFLSLLFRIIVCSNFHFSQLLFAIIFNFSNYYLTRFLFLRIIT